ncbi:hypothetical protein Y1Q_0011269 [Alligator mississippiensis]|uniref:Uncharacterized protein n=1 Tax=Alligator mississippiensis TaxID=8496 RepID=A0A151N8W2_ALLMI|nr:hypothetical protein Y1Q_0011269 [Alligator mississippiensis]
MDIHLDKMQQLLSMAYTFMSPAWQLVIECGAIYCTLSSPSILDCTTDFQMANEDEAIQDTMEARVLWHHLQTIENQFWIHATSAD